MKKVYSIKRFTLLIFLPGIFLNSCRDRTHRNYIEGWDYNNPENGGFQKITYEPMETPPEMVLIEGCDFNQLKNTSLQKIFSFTINDSVYYDSVIAPFFISKYEETNFQYRSYLEFLKFHGLIEEYQQALPDTTVWSNSNLSDDNITFLIRNYFRHPHYDFYPVVGVTPEQAQLYSNWKTDRLNEAILIREGILEFNDDTSDFFTTEKYLSGEYPKPKLPELDPGKPKSNTKYLGERRVRMEDGILLPRLRLMTVSEWQWASLCIGDSENKYIVTPKAMKQSKMDKDKHFSYLYSQKNKPDIKNPATNTVHPVWIGFANKYGVYNLNGNVSEIIHPDSTYVTNMGGSWKFPEYDYSAIYEKTHPLELNYKIPFDFVHRNDSIQKPNAYTGFRLAMDYLDYGHLPHLKRKSGK